MKILLAEDTKDLNKVVTQMLEMQGFDVDSAFDGEEALKLALSNGYDGIVLDIMMPKMSGLDVLKEIRSRNIVTPVLMLTAKAEVDDRVEGLDAGADDYLTKPFAMKELMARVKALTRRGSQYAAKELSFGDLTLKSESLELIASNTVRLSIKEFSLMQALLLNQEHEVDNNYLIEHVWNDEKDVSEETVWLYVNFLQGKLSYVDSNVEIKGDKGGPFKVVVNE
ncbi:MAG: response regulator transcription factor [Pseudobutyrivibrio sp.]|uniref:Stage 0 sporulation protein A homolog n=1 Tax=Pseudobutyrivibrio ruminis TaxID=46206 RepID=A0A927YLN3_9FIRM|nr:response regulator transcription factor [Pseudobutyrivibrio sp.]MBE5919830.1 response regulator transcription factor [Pseudobutyrivibrio ruminis]MBQ3773959.1 response regulator transcription factor [Pseudobutyrivibrio sp.]MBQ6464100.1 response regulator transcription factor [Pseudobutyrivibrio sp.]